MISAANSASVKIFASSYSFNVHLSYMKQNGSLFDQKKKKKKKEILGKVIVDHRIISIQSYLNNDFLQERWGFLFDFFFPQKKELPPTFFPV